MESCKRGVNGGGITKRILHSGISRVAVPSNKDWEEIEFQYGSVLVLHLQCKNICTMTLGALDAFLNLKNLYLYKNNIKRIQGLDALRNLELLDLSRNNVERIDNLDKCKKLKKLYLGFNEIQVVEGLEGLTSLEELHIDDQDMPPEQPIIFSPGIMASVACSLVILDLSSNQLKTLEPIGELCVLNTLLAADNNFSDFDVLVDTLEKLRKLRVLTLKGNPIASRPNYKPKVIGAVFRLEVLDGKDISDTTRVSIQKLRLMKEHHARKREEAAMRKMRQQDEYEQSLQNSHHIIDIGQTSDFNFSTPTRLSPLPAPKTRSAWRSQPFPYATCSKVKSSPEISKNKESQAVGKTAIDNSPYESRARNPVDDDFLLDVVGSEEDQMSDMAKIIFRLSNLDDTGPGGDGGNAGKMRHVNYWEFPGSSLLSECRPLSPLDGEQNSEMSSPITPSYSTSAPELVGHVEKRSSFSYRPKPAAPGGRRCSNNASKPEGIVVKSSSEYTVAAAAITGTGNQFQNQRHFYGRTLSPLMELPTPESLTARDENN